MNITIVVCLSSLVTGNKVCKAVKVLLEHKVRTSTQIHIYTKITKITIGRSSLTNIIVVIKKATNMNTKLFLFLVQPDSKKPILLKYHTTVKK